MECPYCEADNAAGAIMCINCGRMFGDARENLMKLKGSAMYKDDKKMSQQEYMMLHSWEMAQERLFELQDLKARATHLVLNSVMIAMVLLITGLVGIFIMITVNPGSETEEKLLSVINYFLM